MPSPPSTKPPAAFVCGCEEWMRPACKGLSFFKEKEGKRYCVLHYPGEEKSTAFRGILQRKLDAQDFKFHGVWFPDKAEFRNFTFKTDAYFFNTTFSKGAAFTHATFNGTASFFAVSFNVDAHFGQATFTAKADFKHATFDALAVFYYTTFSAGASFEFATFKDYVIFVGSDRKKVFDDNSSLNLQFARVEKPDSLSFHTLRLRHHWFVNVDARKFEFINVNWDWVHVSINQEIQSIDERDVLSSHRLLVIACRNLAVNAEENHRYEEASRFRYMAMEARRRERGRGVVPWGVRWWYWLASGYGERVWRAFVVLIGVWLLAAAVYMHVGFVRWEPRVSSEQEAAQAKRDEVGAPLPLTRALTYSLGVMTLQKPEPRPATDAAQAVVMSETILGPVQAALLA